MTVLPPLPDAMADLLPSAAPPRWQAAVRRAGQLLTPVWPDQARTGGLGVLALLLYTLGHDHGAAEPDSVPVSLVREALAGNPDDAGGRAKKMIDSLRTLGHLHSFDDDDAVSHLARELLSMQHWDDLACWEKPNPSTMASCTPWLRTCLDALNEAQLPPAVEPAGALQVTMTQPVYLVNHAYTVPLKCGRGSHHVGGTLRVDGAEVSYRCRCGHTQADDRLGTAHVRQALKTAAVSQGHLRGPLLVATASLPCTTDPVAVHHANREAWLPPV